MTSKDTLTVIIPIQNILEIQLQNKGGSAVLTVLTIFGIMNVIGAILFIATGGMNIEMDFGT